ncbi:MAG: aminotransferase class V-fold PLP-dependent enzyme [bacterium]|nr:aminotransferase class V-fold PLP-dependent enzyme [bacterium]
MQKKNLLLFTPGPLQVSERVLEALRNGNLMHREEAFSALFSNLQSKLLNAFEVNEEYAACLFTSTGRGINEAMVAPFAKNRKLAVITNGAWGTDLLQIARLHGQNVMELKFSEKEAVEPGQVAEFLKQNPQIDSLALVHQETRTGILNPLEKIASAAAANGVTLLVDAMSSIIAEETNFQKLGVAFFTCGSTKGLRSIPGIGIICGKKEEFEKLSRFVPTSHYFDIFSEYESQVKNKKMRFAQPTPIFAALNESLSELLEEGLQQRRESISQRTADFRNWAVSNGIEIDGVASTLGHVITNFKLPSKIKYSVFSHELQKLGIYLLYGGEKDENTFQVSFFGAFSENDIAFLKKTLISILK